MYKILLVEDEEIIRTGIKHLITKVSSEFEIVKEAAHGKEALAYLQTEIPDVVITDIRMREMDGLSLIAKVRERYPHMPLLIISGYSDFEYAQKALRFGVSDYLLKPINRMALVSALERIHQTLERKETGGSTDRTEPHIETATKEPIMKSGEGKRLIRKIKEYIQAHPEGDLRLQTLSDYIHLNPAYLSQLFKSETAINLSDFIMQIRIERAKHLLVQTDLKIYDVARLSGYQSPKHFMLVFKQQVGTSPGSYREEYGS
ncbi:response regulator [Paenibacillus radicis (ex Xue et al. 2023)]|uniref:Response regulator n=1 Tax=Paenibacillus radicis (ex Xue et al. 2023) TaxID=2972489 RepID=A0ABT1YBR7_9BACL|nr:response regulator [Paenibacillus radicis (ex Xue et al. 2023)]MCR8629834.1 response regulator [Paenibacillus radicis (ex Xue et al. 2023)]